MVVDKHQAQQLLVQVDLLLLLQPAVVAKQHQVVDKQQVPVQRHQVQYHHGTHIHSLQVARTVSTVIVFVMQGLTLTRRASKLVPLVDQFVLYSRIIPKQVDGEVVTQVQTDDTIVHNILVVLIMAHLTYTQEQQLIQI